MRAGVQCVPHLSADIKVPPGMPFFSVYNDFVTILLAIMLAVSWMLNDSLSSGPTSPLLLFVWGCRFYADWHKGGVGACQRKWFTLPNRITSSAYRGPNKSRPFPLIFLNGKHQSLICVSAVWLLNETPESPAGRCGVQMRRIPVPPSAPFA